MLGAVGRHRGDGGRVDYAGLRASPLYGAIVAQARRLQPIDLGQLEPRGARLAFWINVYNALVLHGVIALGLRRSVWETWNFFGRVSYRVGGFTLSIDEIEHGILRGNRGRRLPPWRPFRRADPRRALPVDRFDPRIHFAINCGADSCPPVAVYRGALVDDQLDLAARSFVNQEAALDAGGRIACSKIFKWYRSDFAEVGGLAPFLLRYLDEGPLRRALEAGATPCQIYRPYSWKLTHGP